MHFKRNLWLSFTGASIIVAAVLFSSPPSEAKPGMQHTLPQIKKIKSLKEAKSDKESHAQSRHTEYR
jgi:hypothetical protein